MEFYNPQTGEVYDFGEDQTPPSGWKRFKPAPDLFAGYPPGTTITWIPGREPRLYMDPATGESKWIQWPYAAVPAGWKEVILRFSPPAGTVEHTQYFNPQNGEYYNFGTDKQPPTGWKKLGPIPDPDPWMPHGGTVFYIPGREPKLYIDPATGQMRWIQWPYVTAPAGWVEAKPIHVAPANTEHNGTYFNPATGECYDFGDHHRPPTGWKKMAAIPDPPGMPPGGTVFYIPGKEPKLYIDPETGELQWVQWPYLAVPDGWKPVDPLMAPPAGIEYGNLHFNPQTGEYHDFEEGQTPPPGWKFLGPLPDPTPWLAPGGTVTFIPGREPKLYVDLATGEKRWISGGELSVPAGWIPLVPKQLKVETINDDWEKEELRRKRIRAWKMLMAEQGQIYYPPEGYIPGLAEAETGDNLLKRGDEASVASVTASTTTKPKKAEQESVVWSFLSALPGAIAETFASGEAYSSYAQASQEAMTTITFGWFVGDPEKRAKELEALGYKRPDRQTEKYSRNVGKYVIGPAVQMALMTAAWTKLLKLPTFSVGVKLPLPKSPMPHVVFGVAREAGGKVQWLHAVGEFFKMGVTSFNSFAWRPGWFILSEVPILNPYPVLMMVTEEASVGTSWFCFTAAMRAFFKGWGGW